jgi:hypothetical protein
MTLNVGSLSDTQSTTISGPQGEDLYYKITGWDYGNYEDGYLSYTLDGDQFTFEATVDDIEMGDHVWQGTGTLGASASCGNYQYYSGEYCAISVKIT